MMIIIIIEKWSLVFLQWYQAFLNYNCIDFKED